MIITLNGVETEVDEGATVQQVLDATAGDPGRGVAVAVDRSVVPRSRWTEVTVDAGSRVEIVTAVQGG